MNNYLIQSAVAFVSVAGGELKRLRLHHALELLGVDITMPSHDLIEYELDGVSDADMPTVVEIIGRL